MAHLRSNIEMVEASYQSVSRLVDELHARFDDSSMAWRGIE